MTLDQVLSADWRSGWLASMSISTASSSTSFTPPSRFRLDAPIKKEEPVGQTGNPSLQYREFVLTDTINRGYATDYTHNSLAPVMIPSSSSPPQVPHYHDISLPPDPVSLGAQHGSRAFDGRSQSTHSPLYPIQSNRVWNPDGLLSQTSTSRMNRHHSGDPPTIISSTGSFRHSTFAHHSPTELPWISAHSNGRAT